MEDRGEKMTNLDDYHKQRWNSNEDLITNMFDEMINQKMFKQAREYLNGLEGFPQYDKYDKILRVAEAEKDFNNLGFRVLRMRLKDE